MVLLIAAVAAHCKAYSVCSRADTSKDVALTEDDDGYGVGFYVLTFFSFLLIIFLFPLSLIWSVKIVKDYERAIILRLGQLSSKKAKGPGRAQMTPHHCLLFSLGIYPLLIIHCSTYGPLFVTQACFSSSLALMMCVW